MKNIVAKANIKEDKIELLYIHDGVEYVIEVPKTPMNEGMTQDEDITVLMAVMPLNDPNKQYVKNTEVITDE